MTPRSGRGIAWVSFILGITVSIAANVQHADLDGATIPELVGSGFWPLALMLSIEVLTRVTWPTGRRWSVARFGGVGLVALVAAVLSYRHMAGLLTSWGEDWTNAHLGPLAVDGLMMVSATALLAISRTAPTVEAKPAPALLRVPWRVELTRLPTFTPTTVATSRDPLVLAHATPRPQVVTETMPKPRPVRTQQAAPTRRAAPTPQAKAAPRSPQQTPTDSTSQDRARAHWDRERAAGRTPTGPELATLAGKDRRTGARWAKAWAQQDTQPT